MTPIPTDHPAPEGVQRVVYDEQFLDASWRWFTTTDLGTLTDTAPFTREQQRAWFETLPGRTDYAAWGVALDGEPVGAFGLKHVTDHDAEYWAYLAEPSSRGRGIGQWMFPVICAEGRQRGLTHITGIRWDDPDLAIAWPASEPILSAKDAAAPSFASLASSFQTP